MRNGLRVVAVVVTWNRKELLARNLRAVLAQTRPVDEVLVVDNASTDGTAEMLAVDFPAVRLVRLVGNAGSAGGFHVGVREALASGADWLWLMDDDGYPAPTCLAEQLAVSEREGYALCGALLIDAEDPSRLAFPPSSPRWPTEVQALRRLLAANHFDTRVPGLWNGVVVRARAATSVGLPKAEMFIWGEEREYAQRFGRAGHRVGVALDADYFHPRDRLPARWLMSLKLGSLSVRKCCFCEPTAPRAALYARNLGFTDLRYHGWLRCLARFAAGVSLWSWTRGLKGATEFARYYLDGLTDRYELEPSRATIEHHLAIATARPA